MKRWPVSKAYLWEEAPFLRLLLPLATGIFCYNKAGMHFPPFVSVAIGFIALLLLGVFSFVKRLYRYDKGIVFGLVMAAVFFAGYSVSAFTDSTAKLTWLGRDLQATKAFTAKIISTPQEKDRTWKLYVECDRAMPRGAKVSGKALLYVYKDNLPFSLHEGDVIMFPNHMQQIHNTGNPGEFDYAAYAAHNGLYHQQFSAAADIILLEKAGRPSLLTNCHNWCMLQLQHYLPNRATQTLLQAMLAGDETGMDSDLRNAYAQTGIIHIVSISGSHVAVVFAIVSGMLWWLRNKKYAALKYLVALLPVWFYVLMAGSPPSAVRAAVMFTILAGGMLLQRNPQPLNTLLAAAFFLLCANPAWLFSVGFQLSFVAVLSLIIFYKPLYRLVRPRYRIVGKLWQGVAASIAAEILIAPLVIWYFHSFPMMFIVANLLAAICMGALLIAGMLLLACAPFPVVANCIGWCCIVFTQWFNEIIYALQSFSPASFNFLQLSGWETCLLYAAIAGISWWLIKQYKKALFAGLTAACVLLLLPCIDDNKAQRQKQLIVYNTGKSTYAEIINGKYFSVFCNDSFPVNTYARNALHTQLHAWKERKFNASVLHGKAGNILLLKDQLQYSDSTRFPVDVLIVAAKLKQLSFTNVVHCYQPKQIVIPSGQSGWYAARWKDSCAAHHIACHNTAENGAFVTDL